MFTTHDECHACVKKLTKCQILVVGETMKANILTASLVEIRRNVEKIASAFDAVSPEGLSGTGTRMEKINKGVATAR